jgi:CheY-like chemotaxis protein
VSDEARKPIVLIVDDDEVLVGMLGVAFQRLQAPFEADFCLSGSGALERMKFRCYDAAVVDVDLADLTGTVVGIKMHKADPDLPFAICTNHEYELVEPYMPQMGNPEFWRKIDYTGVPTRMIEEIVRLCQKRPCDKRVVPGVGHDSESPERGRNVTALSLPEAMSDSIKAFAARAGRLRLAR